MEFEDIYRAYFDDVYRYLRRLSGDEHLAEELTSDVFFKALRSVDKFRGECDLRVWLCQIAKNSYYSYLKKSSTTATVVEDALVLTPDDAAPMDERLAQKEDVRRLQAILHTLPDTYKEIFMWRVYAELNFKQIGELFGKSDNWACVTYYRARQLI